VAVPSIGEGVRRSLLDRELQLSLGGPVIQHAGLELLPRPVLLPHIGDGGIAPGLRSHGDDVAAVGTQGMPRSLGL
jgi:hypothetical protein